MNNIRIELKWAIIFSVMTLLWMLLERLVGLHGKYLDYHVYLTGLFAIPAVVVMVLALNDKKRNYYKGQISYRQGLLSGIVLSFLIALLSPLTQWITSYVISPEYFSNVIQRSVELGHYKSTEEAETVFTYWNYTKQGALTAFLMGVITTAIAMIFIRSKHTNQ